MKNITNWIGVIIFLGAGLWCLFGARRLQKKAIEAESNMTIHPFRGFVRSSSYMIMARIVGASSILIAIIVTIVLIFGK